MQTFAGRYPCGRSYSTVDVEILDVYAYHYTLCQKWSGGTVIYLKVSAHPLMSPESIEPSHFPSSNRGEWFFCPGCGCPLWLTLTNSDHYFIPWTLLEPNEVDRRRLILAAEIYTKI